MNLDNIRAEFTAWRRRPDLYGETNLVVRAAALDFLDFVCTVVPQSLEPTAEHAALVADAHRLAEELTGINQALFEQLRCAIQTQTLTGAALRAYGNRFISPNIPGEEGPYTNYDGLDMLIDGLFALPAAPAPTLSLTAEMVHCEETPARVILDLVDQVALGPADRFYDLGCGLGQVVLLVHLLTGVPAYGVEIEPAFVRFARQQATELGLPNVHFINADAQVADYSAGTVFFLFTPFRGQLLQRVLARLQVLATRQPIRVCTFGPCTPVVAAEPWLQASPDRAPHPNKLGIFASR
jgi:SAM-dependent methyltransferase